MYFGGAGSKMCIRDSIYNAYKNTKTCGVLEEDPVYGIKKIAEPIGLIAAVIPTTNPTSTAIFKTLIALKTRNAIITVSYTHLQCGIRFYIR